MSFQRIILPLSLIVLHTIAYPYIYICLVKFLCKLIAILMKLKSEYLFIVSTDEKQLQKIRNVN